jgi:hypothetical protein
MPNVSIPTWMHNCGMHVIADFMIEKLQQEDFKAGFTGNSYEKLLQSFQTCYHQKDLTWEMIRETTLQSRRDDAQIIFGFALRKILPDILKENLKYKKDLYENFLAAFKKYKEKSYDEVLSSYPIILFGNTEYFQSSLAETSDEVHLKYWNETGFNKYCEATVKRQDELGNYLWLGEGELFHCSRYFSIDAVIVHNQSKVSYDAKKIFFHNPSERHWERYIEPTSAKNTIEKVAEKEPSDFYKTILNHNLTTFENNIGIIGQIYFKGLYAQPKLGLKWVQEFNAEEIGKYFVKNDMANYIKDIKSNKTLKEKFALGIQFIAANFAYEVLKSWIDNTEITEQFSIPYAEMLLGATKYKDKSNVEQLLKNFPQVYTIKNCMPALISASKYDRSEMAEQILKLPGFNKKK